MTTNFDWTGRVGDVWAEEWQRTDRSLAGLARRLDAAILAVAPHGGTAIDLGCGAGGTSIALATARPQLAVTGIDLSPSLIAIARERAAGIPNLAFRVADAQSLGGAGADLLVSRHGVMFFDDPVAGFSALRDAANPGARLVFSCFRARTSNEWAVAVDDAVGNDVPPSEGYTPGPFGLSDPGFTADVFARAGWTEAEVQSIDFTYVAGEGEDPVEDALGFFSRIGPAARAMIDAAPDRRGAMRESLRAMLAARAADEVVAFGAGAWIWTATAGEPA
ncbi:MAG: class I SAM-dependent methyltransferase [Sphingomonas sp.]|uniref:class I SAM-dependent methyltransferase n=1 Tax=Sphingomonas sp. TaxID=28214 RepID=UPI001B085191|nr:class I SAM-dependent methyltransferase [Sphingomonas sp.]MBO9623121.1 class I SAM-dependent methyltransferase [Sphingomonas sp.]